MAAHRLPRAPRGDAHLLVVVAGRAARRERVAEPEAARATRSRWRRRRTWRCPCRPRPRGTGRRRRSARPAAAARPARPSRRHEIVGDVEQPGDEQPVARLDLGRAAPPRSSGGCFTTKPPFAPVGHDHRVLDLLRLHEPEHLGAEVFAPVRPADAAARDPSRRAGARLRRAASTRRSRTSGRGSGRSGTCAGSSLRTTHGRGRPSSSVWNQFVRSVASTRCRSAAQDAVFVEARDRVELVGDLRRDRVGRAALGRPAARRFRAGSRRAPNSPTRRHESIGVRGERVGDVGLAERRADLAEVAAVRAQQRDLAPRRARRAARAG